MAAEKTRSKRGERIGSTLPSQLRKRSQDLFAVLLLLMGDVDVTQEAVKSLFSIGTSAVVLCLGWLVGQRLTYSWNLKQKRREIQLSSTQQFYIAYGEFFAVWKLWNRLDRTDSDFGDRRWELHKRAAAAEAVIEGTLVKVSSELTLTEEQLCLLGQFRQGFQQLRQSIRMNRELSWSNSAHPEYEVFKTLTSRMAVLLSGDWKGQPPAANIASSQLLKITANTWEATWAG